jgi:AcrR family transcriptional regulator
MQSVPHCVYNRAGAVSFHAFMTREFGHWKRQCRNSADRLKGPEIQMPVTTIETRKRLTREESRALTRSRLIAVGRAHFLRYGLGGAVAEKIAEEAGYSRGALYSNFDGKEELFLAVIYEQEAHRFEVFRSILNERSSSKERLRKLHDTFADVVTDHDWIVLHTEFQAEALRSERIRESFLKFHRQTIRDGEQLIKEILKSSEVTLNMKPSEFIMTMLSFSLGLAINQKLLGSELSQRSTRALIQSLFDDLISVK